LENMQKGAKEELRRAFDKTVRRGELFLDW
jgi:hypothetical protein